MKAGMLYCEIARKYLETFYPDMSQAERKAIVDRKDFEEIEGYIGAERFIRAAIDGIELGISRIWGYALPNGFVNFVLFDTELSKQGKKILQILRGTFAYADIILNSSTIFSSLMAVHDQWIKDNAKKFFDLDREDRMFMFLPLLMIGWEETQKDLIFVEPIVSFLGVATHDIEDYYKDLQVATDINEKTMIDHMENPEWSHYKIASPMISDRLLRDESLRSFIAKQAAAKIK